MAQSAFINHQSSLIHNSHTSCAGLSFICGASETIEQRFICIPYGHRNVARMHCMAYISTNTNIKNCALKRNTSFPMYTRFSIRLGNSSVIICWIAVEIQCRLMENDANRGLFGTSTLIVISYILRNVCDIFVLLLVLEPCWFPCAHTHTHTL